MVFRAINAVEGLPDSSSASEGDVLTIGNDGAEWTAPSGGITKVVARQMGFADFKNAVMNMNVGDMLVFSNISGTESSYVTRGCFTCCQILDTGERRFTHSPITEGYYGSATYIPNVIVEIADIGASATNVNVYFLETYKSGSSSRYFRLNSSNCSVTGLFIYFG